MFIPFSYVLHFTQSHGQEKSLSYYDLFDFGVLLYGRIPTLVFFHILYNPTTPKLPVYVDKQRTYLQQDPPWTRSMVQQKVPLISRLFWRYSDLYLSPYFVPSQEPAFGPILYLRTCFGPQDAISDPSPPAYYFRISGLSLVLFLLAPPIQRLYCLISTLSLT